ncbi:MAG: CHASE3 domain-containing protein [Ignavibacteria bacterium]|nr:CHASE3 domain-containing protein [Ignavibacteria bacterium]
MEKRKIINAAFLCAILILIAISYAVYVNLMSLHDNAELVKKSYNEINLLARIEKSIIDGETGQRGYIITGNNSYLEPYYGSKKEINFLLEQYKNNLSGNTAKLEDYSHLDRLINKKFYELNYTVELKEKKLDDSVISRINSDIGKVYMDSIRTVMNELLTKENLILKNNEEVTLASSRNTLWSYSIGFVISFGIIIFVFLSLRRENELRKKMEAEANQSKLFFSTSLISIGDAVITTDAKGIITFMNKVAEAVTKWSSEEAKGRNIESIFNIYREGTREVVPSPVKRALETKQIVGLNNHTILLDKFGNEIHIDDSAAPILNENEEVTGAVLIFRDITAKRQTEIDLQKSYEQVKELNKEMDAKINELQHLNKDLESFTYSVSHDLRAPLRSIDGFSKIVLTEYENVLDDEGKRLLNIVRDNAVKMGVFIDELLNFSKLGRKALVYNVTDFTKLVEDAIVIIGGEEKNKAVINIKPLLPAYVDEVLMFEVWKNLISNALKFSSKKENPEIEIGCYVTDNGIRYYVKDNGAGFNAAYANKLFGVFQRLHSDSEFPGNGVGLALCEKIIRLHGGTISAESKINEETVFSFTIPNRN